MTVLENTTLVWIQIIMKCVVSVEAAVAVTVTHSRCHHSVSPPPDVWTKIHDGFCRWLCVLSSAWCEAVHYEGKGSTVFMHNSIICHVVLHVYVEEGKRCQVLQGAQVTLHYTVGNCNTLMIDFLSSLDNCVVTVPYPLWKLKRWNVGVV